jgi:hypothetical protein
MHHLPEEVHATVKRKKNHNSERLQGARIIVLLLVYLVRRVEVHVSPLARHKRPVVALLHDGRLRGSAFPTLAGAQEGRCEGSCTQRGAHLVVQGEEVTRVAVMVAYL